MTFFVPKSKKSIFLQSCMYNYYTIQSFISFIKFIEWDPIESKQNLIPVSVQNRNLNHVQNKNFPLDEIIFVFLEYSLTRFHQNSWSWIKALPSELGRDKLTLLQMQNEPPHEQLRSRKCHNLKYGQLMKSKFWIRK